jgi:hypothetical protein
MAYPCQPVFDVLPQFRGTASVRQTPIHPSSLYRPHLTSE